MVDITESLEHCLLVELKCVSCQRFLSVPPLLIDQDGKVVCGRCADGISADLKYVRNTFYEVLAQKFNFPCSFIDEGCSIKKKFAELKTHEGICPYQTTECQVKKCNWSGALVEIVTHFKKEHEALIVQKNIVKELQEKECCFMLVVNGFYFLLKLVYCDYKFNLNVKNLNVLYSFDDAEFHFKLFTVDPKFPINILNITKIDRSATIDSQKILNDSSHISLFFAINTQLPTDVINRNNENLKKIICSYCKHQMVPPILKCPIGHITCVDCTTSYYDTCVGCDIDELKFTRVPDFETIAEFSQYTCRWQNCKENFSVRQIQKHEQNCPKRIYECRHCIEWTGSINEIISHDVVCTHRPYLRCVAMNTKATVLGTDIKENINEKVEYWLIAFNEYFAIDFEPLVEGIDILVSNYGLPSLFYWYGYEVDLHHIEDSNFLVNKTYTIKNRCSNVNTILIPASDTAKFCGPEFYKITVRILLLSDVEKRSKVSSNLFSLFK